MLTVNPGQMAAFAALATDRFRDTAIGHVRRAVPDMAGEVAERLVDHALARSRHHDIREVVLVLDYIDLMLRFGVHFDVDPARPEFARALAGGDHGWEKINRARMAAEGRDADLEIAAANRSAAGGVATPGHFASWQ